MTMMGEVEISRSNKYSSRSTPIFPITITTDQQQDRTVIQTKRKEKKRNEHPLGYSDPLGRLATRPRRL